MGGGGGGAQQGYWSGGYPMQGQTQGQGGPQAPNQLANPNPTPYMPPGQGINQNFSGFEQLGQPFQGAGFGTGGGFGLGGGFGALSRLGVPGSAGMGGRLYQPGGYAEDAGNFRSFNNVTNKWGWNPGGAYSADAGTNRKFNQLTGKWEWGTNQATPL